MEKIRKLKIGNRDLIGSPLFWRNDVVSAWCISKAIGNSKFCDENEYWIEVYDIDAPAYAGKVRFSFSTYGGMCGYNFNNFFRPQDIDNEKDLAIQEAFLEKINELIDKGILVMEDKNED